MFTLFREMRCPSPDVLLPAVEGTLDEPVLTRVRSHVSTCAVCRELTSALEAAAEAGPTAEERARLDARQPRRPGRARVTWWTAAAAASLVLVTSAFWFSQFTEFRSFELPAVATVAVRTQAPQQFVLPLDAPFIDLPKAPIVLRGGETDPFVAALLNAAAPLHERDYRAAATRMIELRRQYPDRPHPAYYEGISLLLSSKPAESIEPLEQARRLSDSHSSLYIDASWYLAVALERVGRRSEAATVLTEMCGNGGARDEQACLALHQMLTPLR